MRIWIDALTPKQLIFLGTIAKRLVDEEVDVLFTTRGFREVLGLIKRLDFPFEIRIIGSYGKTLKEKLVASLERMLELVDIVDSFSPDATLAFGSPDAARISFGLGIPIYNANDSPHAYHALKLSLPYTKKLFASKYIPIDEWTKYCIDKRNIVLYDAIDQIVWLRNFKPNKNTLRELGLSEEDKFIMIRETEVFASYIITYFKKISLAPTSEALIPRILEGLPDAKIVVVPRYEDQIRYLKELFEDPRVIIVDRTVYAPDILYFASLFIGGGGTMTGEAALLGVPAIAFFPRGILYIEKFLLDKGLLFRAKNVNEIIDIAKRVFSDEEIKARLKKLSQQLRNSMEDPTEIITRTIMKDQNH